MVAIHFCALSYYLEVSGAAHPPLLISSFTRARLEALNDCFDGGPHAWIGGREEPHNRHHKIGGIQVIRAKRLGKCSSFLAPSLSEDGVTDLLTCRCPGINPVMRIQYIGKFDSAVK